MEIAIILISILLSAFFSGLEIAYVSANKLQIELEKKKEGFTPKILRKLTQSSSKFITTMLVGNNIALVIYSYFMGKLIVQFLPIDLLNNYVVLLIQTVISTIIILVTAEFLPKAIFRVYSNEALKMFAVPAYLFYLFFHYISDFITSISDFILKKLFNSTENVNQTEFSKQELGNYISEQLDVSNDAEEIDSEIQIFQNALEFHNVKAREIMIPRTEIKAVELRESISNLTQLFVNTGFSKIIVYNNSLDDIEGYVHSFEMFKKPKTLRSVVMPVEIVPESMMINDVLNILIKKKKSIAVVLDEYGGTSGIVTVEDIVEELFGEIEDEHDSIELLDEKINDREFNLSARLEVDYINDTYNLALPKEDAYETLGGFVMYHSENVSKEGDIVQVENYQFTMLKVTTSKIEEVYLKVIDKQD